MYKEVYIFWYYAKLNIYRDQKWENYKILSSLISKFQVLSLHQFKLVDKISSLHVQRCLFHSISASKKAWCFWASSLWSPKISLSLVFDLSSSVGVGSVICCWVLIFFIKSFNTFSINYERLDKYDLTINFIRIRVGFKNCEACL